MESNRFDRLAKALGLATTRRVALATLLAGVLQEAGTAAGHHRRGERRKRRAEREAEAAQTRRLPPPGPGGPTLPVEPGGPTPPGLPPERICRAICPGCCVGPEGADCVTCANPTPICGNRACVACASAQECVAAGRGNLCCNGSCESGFCCANADCVNPAPICAHHICAACASDAQCAVAGKGTLCCNGACISANDPNNCGGCGVVCPASAPRCHNGVCACDVCASGCPFNSVQAAVNAAGDGATITICPGVYQENVTIFKSLTLIGAGDGSNPAVDTILQGTGDNTVLRLEGVVMALQNLRITGGVAGGANGYGGGINNSGNLTLTNCTVQGNTAYGNDIYGGGATFVIRAGGGIINSGTLTLNDCRVSNNSAREGGGIYNYRGTVALNGGSVTGNSATANGGGIYNNVGTVTLNGSTVTGNSAGTFGGGIYNAGTVTCSGGSEVSGNWARPIRRADNCYNAPGFGAGCSVLTCGGGVPAIPSDGDGNGPPNIP